MYEDADSGPANASILVIATLNTALAARVMMALADVGFRVAALTPRGHPARRLRKLSNHFEYHARPRLKSILRAIDGSSPDLLVCADDPAVEELLFLHKRMASAADKSRRNILQLIEHSLGPPASFPTIRSKSEFLALAEAEGLRTPQTLVFPAGRWFETEPPHLNYPIVVKADQSFGGRCVRIANNEGGVRAAVWELQTPATWRDMFRRLFGAVLQSDPSQWLKLPLRRTISVQQYIKGRPSNRAVICWKGEVLAGISVEVVEVTSESRPASVVRLIDHPEMTMAAKHIVQRFALSGFMGFDFVLDSENKAWLIELNPRVTPICHFRLADDTNLAGSLYTQMSGLRPRSLAATVSRDMVALFPNEVVRSPSGEYLQRCQLDVPWNEPEFVCSVLRDALRVRVSIRARTFLNRLKRHFRSRLAVSLGLTVSLGERKWAAVSMRHRRLTFPQSQRRSWVSELCNGLLHRLKRSS